MFKKVNARAKKLTLMDIKLLNLAVLFAAIILVKFFPRLSAISLPVLVILMIAFLAKPFYSFWLKK